MVWPKITLHTHDLKSVILLMIWKISLYPPEVHDLKSVILPTWGPFIFRNSLLLEIGANVYFCSPFVYFCPFMFLSTQKKKKKKKKRRRRQNKILEKQDQKIALVSFHSHRSWTRRIYPLEKSNPDQPLQKQKDGNKVSH